MSKWKETKTSLEDQIKNLEEKIALQSQALITFGNRNKSLETQLQQLIYVMYRSA